LEAVRNNPNPVILSSGGDEKINSFLRNNQQQESKPYYWVDVCGKFVATAKATHLLYLMQKKIIGGARKKQQKTASVHYLFQNLINFEI
jgi:hypothetical protein